MHLGVQGLVINMEICVLTNGHVVVIYNKHRLSSDDDDVFRWAVVNFKHLVNRNSAVTLRKFAELITQTYALDDRLSVVLDVIQKASISMIVTCSYRYNNNGIMTTDHKVVELELFTDLEREIAKISGQESVEILASAIVACPFVKGTISQRYGDKTGSLAG